MSAGRSGTLDVLIAADEICFVGCGIDVVGLIVCWAELSAADGTGGDSIRSCGAIDGDTAPDAGVAVVCVIEEAGVGVAVGGGLAELIEIGDTGAAAEDIAVVHTFVEVIGMNGIYVGAIYIETASDFVGGSSVVCVAGVVHGGANRYRAIGWLSTTT